MNHNPKILDQAMGRFGVLLLCGLLCGQFTALFAQNCNVDISAVTDQNIVCSLGDTVTLSAVGTTTPYAFEWSPSNVVFSDSTAVTQAAIFSTTAFSLTTYSFSDDNLVVNPDFSAGNNNFTSDYLFFLPSGPNTLLLPGSYTVTDNGMNVNDEFADCPDHTDGMSDMMVVNGNATLDADVWCQDINIQANTDYVFSTWVTALTADNPPIIQLSVNDSLLGNAYEVGTTACDWQQVVQEWNSGTATTATICVTNQNDTNGGNDFALDDFFFGEICVVTSLVTVISQATSAEWQPQAFCLDDPPIDLNTLLSPNATTGGIWVVDGSGTNTFDPAALGLGPHTVSYTVGTPPCTMTQEEMILVDTLRSVDWTPIDNICLASMAEPLSNWLDPGTEDIGVWTLDGDPVINFDPVIWGVGPHELTYTIGNPNCMNQQTRIIDIEPLPNPLWLSPGIQCPFVEPFPLSSLLADDADTTGVWRIDGDTSLVFSPVDLGPGNYSVSYTVGEEPCNAELTQNILVVSEVPQVNAFCSFVTESSVIFGWVDIPTVQSYEVEVIDGPAGVVNGLFYLVLGIPNNETVTIRVRGIGPGGCPGPWSEVTSCTSGNCPPLDPMLSGPTGVCFDSVAAPIELTVNPSLGAGTGTFSGPGIMDASMGLIDVATAGIGEHRYYFEFVDIGGSCTYLDSIDIFVAPTPIVDITGNDQSCAGDETAFVFNGDPGMNGLFSWDYGTGEFISGGVAVPILVRWDDPGPDTLRLTVDNSVCPPASAFWPLEITAPIEPPVISCAPTPNSITFSWPNDPDVASYEVIGPVGVFGTMTSDTSWVASNLSQDEEVSIELILNSDTPCPDTMTVASCTAQNCPPVNITIDPVITLCEDPNSSIQLMVNTSQGGGTGVWQGNGVVDTLLGVFEPAVAGVGVHTINYIYTIGLCQYTDNISITVEPAPVAGFTIPTPGCQTDTLPVTFLGPVGPMATINWDFSGADIISNVGNDYEISWPTPGSYDVTLIVAENGCSDTSTITVVLDEPLLAPVVDCTPTETDITFTWTEVDNALLYDVILNSPGTGNQTGPTTYVVTDILPGTTIDINLQTISDNNCPDVFQDISCQTLACPNFLAEIVDPGAICIGTDTFNLAFNIDGAPQLDSVVWMGDGIIDTLTGQWWPDPAFAGTTVQITAEYTYKGVCTYQATVDIPIVNIPTSTLDLPDTTCVNTIVTAQATAGFNSYTWYPNEAMVSGSSTDQSIDLSWDQPGTYTVGVQVDDGACPSDTVFSTIEVVGLAASIPFDCQSDLSSVTFTWTPPAVFSNFEVEVTSGPMGTLVDNSTYQVTGLMAEESVTIEVRYFTASNCPPSVNTFTCSADACPSIIADWNAPAAICEGDNYEIFLDWDATTVTSLELFGTLDGNPWQITATNGLPVLTGVGTNTINIVLDSIRWADFPQCTQAVPAPLSINIVPAPNAGSASLVPSRCGNDGSTINFTDFLTAADPGGTWTQVAGPTASSGLDLSNGVFSIVNAPSGSYTFRYTVESLGSCPADSEDIIVDILSTPIADAGPDQDLDCFGNEINLGSSNTSQGPGITYQWVTTGGAIPDGGDQLLIEVNQPDTYILQVTDTNSGCTAEDQVTVGDGPEALIVNAIATDASCFDRTDGSIQIDELMGGRPPYDIRLDGDPIDNAIGNLSPGTYVLTVNDAAGCMAEIPLVVGAPDPVQVALSASLDPNQIIFGQEVRVNLQTNVMGSALDTIIWQPDSIACNNCLSNSFIPTESMLVQATVIDVNGCSASDQLSLIVDRNPRVFSPNVFSPNGDGNNDTWTVFAGQEVRMVKELQIYNRWGEQVFTNSDFPPNIPTEGWDGNFRNEPLPPAVYIYWMELELIDGSTYTAQGDLVLLR